GAGARGSTLNSVSQPRRHIYDGFGLARRLVRDLGRSRRFEAASLGAITSSAAQRWCSVGSTGGACSPGASPAAPPLSGRRRDVLVLVVANFSPILGVELKGVNSRATAC
ncbi:MAG: hypothetical protein ACRDGN_00480, partial [bacterium]